MQREGPFRGTCCVIHLCVRACQQLSTWGQEDRHPYTAPGPWAQLSRARRWEGGSRTVAWVLFESWPCHLLTVWPWVNYITSER